MEQVVFDTANLSRAQKIALIEKLREELADEDGFEPPAWHQEILDARQEEWENRDKLGKSIDEVRDSLRKRREARKSK